MPTIKNPPFYFSTENFPKRREPGFLMTYHVVCTSFFRRYKRVPSQLVLSFPFARTERTLLMVTPRGRREDQRHLDARKEPRKWLRDTQRGREKEEEREEGEEGLRTAFLSSDKILPKQKTNSHTLHPFSPRLLSYLLSVASSTFFFFFTLSEFNRDGQRPDDPVNPNTLRLYIPTFVMV